MKRKKQDEKHLDENKNKIEEVYQNLVEIKIDQTTHDVTMIYMVEKLWIYTLEIVFLGGGVDPLKGLSI